MKTETKKINLVELSTKELETVQGGYTISRDEAVKKYDERDYKRSSITLNEEHAKQSF